jgi:amidase
MEGQETVPSVIGPLAHNVADLRFLFKSICQTQPWHDDPKVLPLPWRADEEEKSRDSIKEGGLTFGVIKWDGVVMPHPPVQRAIQETISKLKAQGHEVCQTLKVIINHH